MAVRGQIAVPGRAEFARDLRRRLEHSGFSVVPGLSETRLHPVGEKAPSGWLGVDAYHRRFCQGTSMDEIVREILRLNGPAASGEQLDRLYPVVWDKSRMSTAVRDALGCSGEANAAEVPVVFRRYPYQGVHVVGGFDIGQTFRYFVVRHQDAFGADLETLWNRAMTNLESRLNGFIQHNRIRIGRLKSRNGPETAYLVEMPDSLTLSALLTGCRMLDYLNSVLHQSFPWMYAIPVSQDELLLLEPGVSPETVARLHKAMDRRRAELPRSVHIEPAILNSDGLGFASR